MITRNVIVRFEVAAELSDEELHETLYQGIFELNQRCWEVLNRDIVGIEVELED